MANQRRQTTNWIQDAISDGESLLEKYDPSDRYLSHDEYEYAKTEVEKWIMSYNNNLEQVDKQKANESKSDLDNICSESCAVIYYSIKKRLDILRSI